MVTDKPQGDDVNDPSNPDDTQGDNNNNDNTQTTTKPQKPAQDDTNLDDVGQETTVEEMPGMVSREQQELDREPVSRARKLRRSTMLGSSRCSTAHWRQKRTQR